MALFVRRPWRAHLWTAEADCGGDHYSTTTHGLVRCAHGEGEGNGGIVCIARRAAAIAVVIAAGGARAVAGMRYLLVL